MQPDRSFLPTSPRYTRHMPSSPFTPYTLVNPMETAKMTAKRRIGAPNSIARYASNTEWGQNEWAVFEYVAGVPVVRAAGTKGHCEAFMAPGRVLVDVRAYRDDWEPTPDTCHECGELAVGWDAESGAMLCAAHYRGKPAFWEKQP